MESIQEMLRRFYGYVSYNGRRNYEPRSRSKHQASKRGHKHNHRLSLGERNHLKFVKG